MRTTFLAFLLLVPGCVAPKPGRVSVRPHPETAVPPDLTEQTRYPEVVVAYHVGRYVDSDLPSVMHEAHTVYRVEGQVTWNLHSPPAGIILPPGVRSLTNTAFQSPPMNDAVAAELNQQRSITRVVTQQAESLNGSLREFSAALSNMRGLAQENLQLREQLVKAGQRLDALEAEIKRPAPEKQPDQQPDN